MNIQHSSRTDEWYTPPHIIEMVREVLGTIDLDPASSVEANRFAEASTIYTVESDGLIQRWYGSVYCNPPGGKTGNKSNAALWWQKLMHSRGLIDHAIFMAFSLEALQTSQNYGVPGILEFPICVPRKRIRFLDCYWQEGPAPSHSNVIAYIPGRLDRTSLFLDTFEKLGTTR